MTSIEVMDLDALNRYISDLWAVYYDTPLKDEEDIKDVFICLRLIARVQARRKVLKERY